MRRGVIAVFAVVVTALPVDAQAHELWIDGECVPFDGGEECESGLRCPCGHLCVGTCHPSVVFCCGVDASCPPIVDGPRTRWQFTTPEPCLCVGRSNRDSEACTLLQLRDWRDADFDGDGVSNDEDNCQCVFNPGQEDMDCDGIGAACEDPCPAGPGNPPDPDTVAPDCANREFVPKDEDGDGLGETSAMSSMNGIPCGGCDPCPGDPTNSCGEDAGPDADADSDTDTGTGMHEVDIRGSGGCGCRSPGVPTGCGWAVLPLALAAARAAKRTRTKTRTGRPAHWGGR